MHTIPPHPIPGASNLAWLWVMFAVLAIPFLDFRTSIPRIKRRPKGFWKRAAMAFVIILGLQHISVLFAGEQSVVGPAVNLALLGVIFWALDTNKLKVGSSTPEHLDDEIPIYQEDYYHSDAARGGFNSRIFDGPKANNERVESFSQKFESNFDGSQRHDSFGPNGQAAGAAGSGGFGSKIFDGFDSQQGEPFQSHFSERPESEEDDSRPNYVAANGFDAYRALGLDVGASRRDIRRRYRELAKEYHPDRTRHFAADQQQEANEKMLKVQRAYEELLK